MSDRPEIWISIISVAIIFIFAIYKLFIKKDTRLGFFNGGLYIGGQKKSKKKAPPDER